MIKPNFSISIIAKNEEQSLPNLLASLKEIIDSEGEIVVVDTDSTDKTVSILESYGFKNSCSSLVKSNLKYECIGDRFLFTVTDELIQEIRENLFLVNIDLDSGYLQELDFLTQAVGAKIFDYGSARRYAEKLCSSHFILSLDCDEVLKHLDIPALTNLISSGKFQQFNFRYDYVQKVLGQSLPKVLTTTLRDKFYDRNFLEWKYSMHEQVKPKFVDKKTGKSTKNIQLGNLPENFLSIDHYQIPSSNRKNYLVQLCVDVLNNEKLKCVNFNHIIWLGRDMLFADKPNFAIKILKSHLKKTNSSENRMVYSHERCMSNIYIGDAYTYLSKISNTSLEKIQELEEKAIKWYLRATTEKSNFREPWLKLACYYQSVNDAVSTKIFATLAINIQDNPKTYLTDHSCYGAKPYELMYWACYALEDRATAKTYFLKAKEFGVSPKIFHDERLYF
jgi:glycosyltransferase involved in cell wall biosynthesis